MIALTLFNKEFCGAFTKRNADALKTRGSATRKATAFSKSVQNKPIGLWEQLNLTPFSRQMMNKL